MDSNVTVDNNCDNPSTSHANLETTTFPLVQQQVNSQMAQYPYSSDSTSAATDSNYSGYSIPVSTTELGVTQEYSGYEMTAAPTVTTTESTMAQIFASNAASNEIKTATEEYSGYSANILTNITETGTGQEYSAFASNNPTTNMLVSQGYSGYSANIPINSTETCMGPGYSSYTSNNEIPVNLQHNQYATSNQEISNQFDNNKIHHLELTNQNQNTGIPMNNSEQVNYQHSQIQTSQQYSQIKHENMTNNNMNHNISNINTHPKIESISNENRQHHHHSSESSTSNSTSTSSEKNLTQIPPIQKVSVSMNPPPVPLDPSKRLHKIIEDLSKLQQPKPKTYDLEEHAKMLLLSYADECASSILEQACLIAKHRKSNVVEQQDIYLVLVKKYSIEVPGYPKLKELYRQNLSMLGYASHSHSHSIREEGKLGEARRAMKRKLSMPPSSSAAKSDESRPEKK